MKIGLEVHVALPTKSKLFCRCSADASEEPNTAICPICMGFPGSKPMLNREAVRMALSIARALGCKTPSNISFLRKIYFYPDLPKSFQITQLEEAVGREGLVEYKERGVRIRRVQIEEDPAKIVRGNEYTLLDFNRSGVPLVEIVTEPDISGEDDLRDFMTELRSILYYLGVDIERELKVDLNISLAEQRVEVKNITGIKNIADAAHYEIERQEGLIREHRAIAAETRSYNEEKMSTVQSREKESNEEYGFIYEPDLATYDVSDIVPEDPVYATRIADSYAKGFHANAQQIREAILFNRDTLRLIDASKDSNEMRIVMNGIAILQRHKALDIEEGEFLRLLELLRNGTEIDAGIIRRLRLGEEININMRANLDELDDEIRKTIENEGALIEEYKSNKKVFNFLVGKIAKKYKASPRYVSERLRLILEGEEKGHRAL